MRDLKKAGPGGLNYLSAVELAKKLNSGEITSVEVVQDCLARISARDKDIGAWKYISADYVMEQAERCDKEKGSGLLHGIPIGIKDNLDTNDMPTGYGTHIYPNYIPDNDSETVAKLRRAGAILLGKTVTSEFAGPFPGPTLNPYDSSRTPGVSSMGSAAGVADYMMPLANGSQTGGSIIRPASLCGIYGYKGSFGHISGDGIRHLKPSIDTLGHFARSIEDLELMRCALTDDTPVKFSDEYTLPKTIGICKTGQWHAAQNEVISMIGKVKECLTSSNTRVEEVILPNEFTDVMNRSFQVIYSWELRAAHEKEIEDHLEEFNPWFQWAVDYAKELTETDFDEAILEAKNVRAILDDIFREVDVILTPSALGEAPKDLKGIPKNNFNNLWTLMYVPCLNLPLFLGPNDLPVGLQIIGPQNEDQNLLKSAHSIDLRIKEYFNKFPITLN